jgi:hypothetical protein
MIQLKTQMNMNKGKNKPRNNIKDKQASIKKDPVQLSDLCPNKCGCETNCELDDYIFLCSSLLDDYKFRIGLKKNVSNS